MSLKISSQKNLPIGVDLGSGTLKMAQLRQSREGIELLAVASAEVPPKQRENPRARLSRIGKAIRELLKSAEFKGRQAILAMPACECFVQPVKIPLLPTKEVDNAVRQELNGKLPYPVAEAVIRHIPAGTVYAEGNEMQERIVVAVPRPRLSAFLNAARGAGLDVVGVDVEACAIVECFERLFRRRAEESNVTLFADIGSTSTQVVVTRGQQMLFARNLSIGGRNLDETVAKALDIPAEQAHRLILEMVAKRNDTAAEVELLRLLEENVVEVSGQITHCLRYCESSFRSQAIERMIFVGGQAHNTRFCQSIAAQLNLPAQVGNPLAGMTAVAQAGWPAGVDARQPQPAWAVAVGLSLGAARAA